VTVDASQLLADQIAAVQRTLPATVAGNLLLAAVLAWALHGSVSSAALGLWVGLLALHCAVNGWVIAATRQRPVTPRNAARRARAGVRSALVLGLVWAGGILGLWPDGDGALAQKFLLVFLVAGVSSGALHSLSPHLPTFTAFFVPTVLAVALAAALDGGAVFQAVAGITVVYGLVTWRYAQSLNRTLAEAMSGRHQLSALAQQLGQEVQRVEQARRARSRLMAAASHDLRQPVHALSLFLGLTAAEPLPAAQARRIALAQRSVESLSAQFDALLDLARLDAGALRVEPRAVAMRPLVENVVEAMRAQAEARGLVLRLRACDAMALTDPLLAERMLRNLVANAIRYTDRGGVLVALRAPAGGGARLQVVDTGIGIAPAEQAQVFEEFAQAEGAAGRGGLGLGLAIVRGCATLLGHAVSLRSAPGRGSRFTIDLQPPPWAELPAAPLVPRQAAAAPDPYVWAPGAPAALAGAVILVIEDDPAVRAATAEALAQWGAEVVAGADVDAVLAPLAARPLRPALIITDGRLAQGAGGLAAVQSVREEYNDDELPALVISADAAALEAARAAGLPALRKPVTPAALAAAVREALAARDGPPRRSGP